MKKSEIQKEYVYEGRNLPVSAKIVGKCLTDLADKNDGKLTPQLLLKEAKSEKHPLHICFTWDNNKAANQYRLDQARQILQVIKVKFTSPYNEQSTTRAFVNVKFSETNEDDECPGKEQFYVSINVAVQNTGYMEYLYQEGKSEMKRLRNKYSSIKLFENVFKEIDKICK